MNKFEYLAIGKSAHLLIIVSMSNSIKRFLNTEEAAELFGYTSKNAFMRFVRESGIPHIRLNARVIRFRHEALEHWLSKRAVGGKQ